ncbi:MAG: MMPL family transporter [Thermodesulfobacteriota bacterium]|nr:MMPL family transporter [Thermodesulfobacteriota bacterium]
MFKCLRNNTPCLAKWWIPWVLRHSLSLLLLILCATGVLLFFTIQNFKIDTDLTEMISNDLPFRQTVKKFHKEFPDLVGSIVVVVNGDIPEQVRQARNILAKRLQRETKVFKSVYMPGSDPFFNKNGLLYLSAQELERQGDSLSEMQPFLALLSQDFSLTGLFSVLKQIVSQQDIPINDNAKLVQLFSIIGDAFSNVGQGKTYPISWQNLMLEKTATSPKNQFIILQPALNSQVLHPAKQGINIIREATKELQLNGKYGVSTSITGKPVISYEDLRSVRTDITIASLVSLFLVGIVLYLGLGSIRLVCAGLSTLLTGLVWTIGFAILLVGSLNMISVTFVVLFIGLAIDYSIQICLRYKELLASGRQHQQAIVEAISTTGNTLLICSISTAIGFYAFVPTAYIGASELGLIAGTGMFFIFLASISMLPALMNLMPMKKSTSLPFSIGGSISILLVKYARLLVAAAVILALTAIAVLPKISFDANPFHLSDQRSESIRTAMQLFQDGKTSPWTISILTSNQQQALKLAERLRQLPEVEAVVTSDTFIPKNQDEKLEQIEDMALFMPAAPKRQDPEAVHQYQRSKEALAELSLALQNRIRSDKTGDLELPAIHDLADKIYDFNNLLTGSTQDTLLFNRLDSTLLSNLEILLNRLNVLMEATAVDFSQLPQDLVSRYISDNKYYRIQVFPRNDLRDIENLQNFVASILPIAPEATDQPVTILGAGKTIVSAFRNASILAFILITLFLRIVMKSWVEVLLVLTPLLLALYYTMTLAALMNISFNFANIIVVPLILGIGVDSSIHVVHRFKEAQGKKIHILKTSTSRGVLFSSLTTIMSFGSLSFMHHAGTASMGKLLTLSVTLIIICTLILLPAYLELFNPYRKQQDPPVTS